MQNEQESFRDSVGTINEKGKRNWIYAKKPFGAFYNKRTIATFIFLLVFFGLPFIKYNGDPFFLINIVERKFILFGKIFWPQDFIIFGLGMVTFIIFIVLFTIVFGRVFCGWACPQTVFMEMVFRKIEYWIEGDFTKQKALDKQKWNQEKMVKKGSKWIIFYIISFLVGNTFLAYIIGIDELYKIITEPISQHKGGFTLMLVFSGIFFFIFAWFREQVCLVVCPYGRLQGVMLDKDSMVVAYDYERGEPRGKLRKGEERTQGDCIDCYQCVQVCPTGIDIRNGTQLECVNCTACIDACDNIMEKIEKPKGLIRVASENNIKNKTQTTYTRRMKAYTVVLVLLLVLEGFLIVSRTDVDAKAMRAKGTLYYTDSVGVRNIYNLKIINKTRETIPVDLKLEDIKGEIVFVGNNPVLKPSDISQSTFFIILPEESLKTHKLKVNIGVYTKGKKLQSIKTTFIGPINFNKKFNK
jgi:cytochrome c oxidase accessory protein FixG